MEKIKARFDGKDFVPLEPVNLPAGTEVDVVIPAETLDPTLAHLVRIVDQFPADDSGPTDLAAQHDHYLYGTPKKDQRG